MKTPIRAASLLAFAIAMLSVQSAYAFYNPQVGRWANRDPIGEIGGINLYGFVGNNAVGNLDSFGWKNCCGPNGTSYDAATQCCEDGKVVEKVSIWVCDRPTNHPLTKILPNHKAVCCDGPLQNCYGHYNNEIKKEIQSPRTRSPPVTAKRKKYVQKEKRTNAIIQFLRATVIALTGIAEPGPNGMVSSPRLVRVTWTTNLKSFEIRASMKIAFLVLMLLITFGSIVFFCGGRSNSRTIPIGRGVELTENVALDVAKRALVLAGEDITKLEAFKYDGSRYFARNTLDQNQGYVLWHRERSPYSFDLVVRLRKEEGRVICNVGATK